MEKELKKRENIKKNQKKNQKKIGGSLLSKDCKDYGKCCPTKYGREYVTEPTKPQLKVGEDVLVTCPPSDSRPGIQKQGVIINIPDIEEGAEEVRVHDAECGRDRYGEIFTINDCECCIDRPESGSVWFLADMERKYFVEYENGYIDLVFESYISNI